MTKENLQAASNFIKLGFYESFDELDKLAAELTNVTSDPASPGAKETLLGGASKPVQEIETSVGTSVAVPEHIKKIINEVKNVTADSTNGPTKIEEKDTTLKGDPHAAPISSDMSAEPIKDVEEANDVESEKKASLIADILKKSGYIK